ncbi:33103_t:CDS:2, partial [Gigaspora margarita]
SLKMPKKNNNKNIRTFRCSKEFTMSIIGNIKASILLYKNLEESTNRTEANRAIILLEQSNKKYNLYTIFELNKVLLAKNGSRETMKSLATNLNANREKVTKYEEMENLVFFLNTFSAKQQQEFITNEFNSAIKSDKELKAHQANHLVERSSLSVIDVPVVLALSALERTFLIKILESVHLGSW